MSHSLKRKRRGRGKMKQMTLKGMSCDTLACHHTISFNNLGTDRTFSLLEHLFCLSIKCS